MVLLAIIGIFYLIFQDKSSKNSVFLLKTKITLTKKKQKNQINFSSGKFCHKEKSTNFHYTIDMQSQLCCIVIEKHREAKSFGMKAAWHSSVEK